MEKDSEGETECPNIQVSQLKHLVKDCGLSHSTLEEVFIKVET